MLSTKFPCEFLLSIIKAIPPTINHNAQKELTDVPTSSKIAKPVIDITVFRNKIKPITRKEIPDTLNVLFGSMFGVRLWGLLILCLEKIYKFTKERIL